MTRPLSSHSCAAPCLLLLAAALLLAATPMKVYAVVCIAPDDGSGTAVMPPTCSTGYLSPDQVHLMINGLPPGTTIIIDASHSRFFPTGSGPGGSLGGELEMFNSDLQMNMRGTGALATFLRNKLMPVQCETHIGPRVRGNPTQSFPTVMFMMQGQLPPGDPDFDLLRINAGNAFGMPSPGHTTLVQQPSGNWNVDSFFDITYRIDFIGKAGGPLSGMSGSTTGTIRMQIGEPSCRCPGDYTADLTRSIDDIDPFVLGLLNDSYDSCADMNGDLKDDGKDIRSIVFAIINGTPCPALDAWETPPSTGVAASSSFYSFGGPGQPPIPAGFFNPGSDPFLGTVLFDGMPINETLYGPTDTIVRRPPLIGMPLETVPIEIVELNLVSASPITVTTGGGMPDLWNVNTAISDTPATGGMMNVSESFPGGGTFSATIFVRPVFAFTNVTDLNNLASGNLLPENVRVQIIDTGDPGSPTNPLQLSFGDGPSQSPWVRQICGQPQDDGIFYFHNLGAGFVPGVQGQPPDPCFQFKPGPMKHVRPGESHYIAPPNRNPGGPVIRCVYDFMGQRNWCRTPAKTGNCPPAPLVLCTRPCAAGPCPPVIVRLVKTVCRAPGVANRGWCFQFYRLRPPPMDCGICP